MNPNERVIRRADRLTAGIVERAKGVNQKADGYSWDKFRDWLRKLLRTEFECHELEVLGQAPVKELDGSFPVVVYFDTKREKDAFIQMVQEANPNLKTLKL